MLLEFMPAITEKLNKPVTLHHLSKPQLSCDLYKKKEMYLLNFDQYLL